MKVTVTRDDGTELDVTASVRVAYDCVRQSLDWGSGFLDHEEVNAIVLLAEACGFPDFEDALREVWAERVPRERKPPYVYPEPPLTPEQREEALRMIHGD
jgi:hypothetical protein